VHVLNVKVQISANIVIIYQLKNNRINEDNV